MSDTILHTDDLPAELQPARDAFIKWSQKALLAEQAASTPKEPLYHYTDGTALRGILKTQALWCFSHLQQKDPAEFEYALRVAMDVLKRQTATDDFFKHHFAACVIDMLETNRLSGPFEFYLFSVSRHRDHGPQWTTYGRGGTGYAIGLSPALFQPEKDDLFEEANKNLHIGRVIYGDRETAGRHERSVQAAADITSQVGSQHRHLVRSFGIAAYLRIMTLELLASQMIWNCLTAKAAKFEDEREVRGIIMNVRDKFDPWRRTHAGRHYIEHVLPLKQPGSITEILVGPDAATDAEAKVRALLKAEGYPASIPVQRGMAPIPFPAAFQSDEPSAGFVQVARRPLALHGRPKEFRVETVDLTGFERIIRDGAHDAHKGRNDFGVVLVERLDGVIESVRLGKGTRFQLRVCEPLIAQCGNIRDVGRRAARSSCVDPASRCDHRALHARPLGGYRRSGVEQHVLGNFSCAAV
jgi:hypothetical protein